MAGVGGQEGGLGRAQGGHRQDSPPPATLQSWLARYWEAYAYRRVERRWRERWLGWPWRPWARWRWERYERGQDG